MNEHDSEVMVGLLEDMGYTPSDSADNADLILLNTCCVRETAENKVYALLGRLRKLKQSNPALLIGIGGCMTQQEETAKRIKSRFPHVDIIFGTHNLHELPRLITQARETGEGVLEVWPGTGDVVEEMPIKRAKGVRAWVAITYGCNNFCTYCIVPYVRGRERSRQPEKILAEVKSLVNENYKEITLLGQNVNSYGKDLEEKTDFAQLLTGINAIEGLQRIRFMTSHPRDFNDRLIETMARCENVCEHIHLPVQAGSNDILKKMNRGYTREYYMDLVSKIRALLPDVSLTTDIMVGFPGETEEDFSQTMDLIERVGFDGAFTFVYNPRSGTPAARMPEQISEEIKSERIQRLIKRQNELALERNRAELGRVHHVLVEGQSKTRSEVFSGRTRTNKLMVFPGRPEMVGELVEVVVTGYTQTHLEGQLKES